MRTVSSRLGTMALVCSSLAAGPAWAHRPTFGQGHPTALTAYPVEDVDISIVVYEPLTCDSDALWMRFEAVAGKELYFQLGVPEIERLAGERPAIALLAPGLPPVDLPFDVPAGLGGMVWRADDVAQPGTFFEPFTQTSSWVWVEQRVTLPADGLGYLVAWNPDHTTGKVWIAVGEVEDFAGVDPAEFGSWNQQVNDFHETGLFSSPPTEPEVDCSIVEETAVEVTTGGCAVGTVAPWWAGLLGVGLVARRRPRPR